MSTKEAEKLTPNQLGGCGTVGEAKLPFPFAYKFFTQDYQKRVSYDDYHQSFSGIGQFNLIKMNRLPDENGLVPYFIEQKISGLCIHHFKLKNFTIQLEDVRRMHGFDGINGSDSFVLNKLIIDFYKMEVIKSKIR